MPDCPKMVLPGCKRPNPKGCHRRAPIPSCRKQVAPYPSYSECMDPVYADDPTECTQCPWPGEVSYDKVSGKPKRRYSTTTHFSQMETDQDINQVSRAYCTRSDPNYCEEPKPPKQCKRPKHNRPPCDYKGTAARRTDKRIRKL